LSDHVAGSAWTELLFFGVSLYPALALSSQSHVIPAPITDLFAVALRLTVSGDAQIGAKIVGLHPSESQDAGHDLNEAKGRVCELLRALYGEVPNAALSQLDNTVNRTG
ncbi:hypothetical protein U0070_003575, partial [Myodes glareolus]